MVKKSEAIVKKDKSANQDAPEKNKAEHVLIENFVSLQRVMTNLAVKFDSLSNQISKLLELFEISAKTLAEKGDLTSSHKEDKQIAEKLDNLLEQNKIIAKGISLLHEKESPMPEQRYPPANMPRAQPPQYPLQPARRIISNEEYPKQPSSDFSKNPRFGMNA